MMAYFGRSETVLRQQRFLASILAASIVLAATYMTVLWTTYPGERGYLIGPHQPFGGDLINLWTAGRMILGGLFDSIYPPASFIAYQMTLLPEDIGVRLWAYPPHSLLFAWPFGIGGFYETFLLWSGLGLVVLFAGARSFGFSWMEASLLTLSPAAMQNVIYGQTGNLACGLMLVALAATSVPSRSAVVATAILTVKPQIGFLLPLIWLRNRRWGMIAGTAAATLVLVVSSALVFGLDVWRGYLFEALPHLSRLEREGSGPFLLMIPSTFVSMRLLDYDADIAIKVHLLVAGAVLAVLVHRLWAERNVARQSGLVLIATCIITPYMHLYDMTVLLAGALILWREDATSSAGPKMALILAWVLPGVLMSLGQEGVPIAPLLILLLFALACMPERRVTAAN